MSNIEYHTKFHIQILNIEYQTKSHIEIECQISNIKLNRTFKVLNVKYRISN